MSLRKSLLRHQIHKSTRAHQSPWLIALGVLASQPITPLFAADNAPQEHLQWSCQANGNNGWACREVAAPGAAYLRPERSGINSSSNSTGNSSSKTPQATRNLTAAAIDWKDEEQLTETQRADIKSACCGAYIEPVREDAEAQMSPQEAPLRASADNSEWLQQSVATLQGDVLITQGKRQIEADSAELNQDDDIATLTGHVRLREPGVLVTGTRAQVQLDTNESTIDNASYLLHESHLRGDADSINIAADKVMTLEDGSFTSCEPDSNAWSMVSSELTLDPNTNQGWGKHVRLEAGGVPVFYTPYIRFPIGDERQSGFLFPSIGYSDSDGLDLSVPYYFNLAPNYDMTLTPRYIGERGEMLEAEFRHLSRYFSTTVSTGYLANDKGGQGDDLEQQIEAGTITQSEAYPYQGEDRWLLGVDQQGGMGQRWYSQIDYTSVSDEDYFRDLGVSSLAVNSATNLKKMGRAGYRSDHWNYEIKALEYQLLTSTIREEYQQLPRLHANGYYQLPANFVLELDNQYTRFDHNKRDQQRIVTGDRLRTDYALTWDQQWLWGFFKPSAKLATLSYQLDDEYLVAGADDSPSFAAPQASLDTGLFFEREDSLFGHGYVQTFEPRLFYFYSERTNQDDLIGISTGGRRNIDFDTTETGFDYNQLFRDTRFVGGDRIDDDNRMTVGLTSRFLDDETGVERFSASLGQIFYFEDRAISLNQTEAQALANEDRQRNTSEMAAQVTARIGDDLNFISNIAWDDSDNNKVSSGNATLRYLDDQYRIFNLSYRYQRQAPLASDPNDLDGDGILDEEIQRNIRQGDVSFVWPIAGNWNLIGRHYYDFTHKRELENLLGVEYNDCCYRVRLVAREWLDNDLVATNSLDSLNLEKDQGIFLEFQLKGLGNIGNQTGGALSDSIVGYEQRERGIQ